MRPVLSRAQMRDFDARLIACGVPGIVLMENAGRGVTDVLCAEVLAHGAPRPVVLVCGTGNNGGDGFVVARHLRARGHDARVFLCGDPARLRGDAKIAHDAWVGLGGAVASTSDAAALSPLLGAGVVVDALFGTGLDRPLAGEHAALVAAMNGAPGPRVAVDVPSGIDADTGATLGASVQADRTVTFAHAKLGLFTPRGARACGVLHVVDLGVPGAVGPALAPAAEALEASDVAALLAPRAVDAHKNSAGHVGVFAGSSGKLGAALLVARAAMRAGAGLATIATWSDAAPAIESRVLEEMVTSLARGAGRDASVDAALAGRRAIAVGPGLGLDDDARDLVAAIAARFEGRAVYDADALTCFAKAIEPLAKAKTTPVLTPHPGEAARLLGSSSEAVESDRYAAARALAAKARAVVVLKGACTLVADPGGRVVVNPACTPALATAGSGDTLAGIVAAMLCSLEPFDAACAAVHLHAAAGALAARGADRGLLASEIADRVPEVLAALTRAHGARRA